MATANQLFDGYLMSICDNQAQYEAVKEIHKEYFPEDIDDTIDLEEIKDEDYEYQSLKDVFTERQEQDEDGEVKIEFDNDTTLTLSADWENNEFVVEIDKQDEDGEDIVYKESFSTFYKDEDGEDNGLSEDDIINAAIDFFGEMIADEYPDDYTYTLKVDIESDDEECEDGKCEDGKCNKSNILDESVIASKLAKDAAHYGLDLNEYVDAIELFRKKFDKEDIKEVYNALN